jgi:hypothetical protein
MRARKVIFASIAILCAGPTLFFSYYGARAAYMALTFQGEGSLGNVGVAIAAVLFPWLAILFGGFTFLAWQSARRSSRHEPPPVSRES